MKCLDIVKSYIIFFILIPRCKISSFGKSCLLNPQYDCSAAENILDFMKFNVEKFLDRLSIASFDVDDKKVYKTIHDLMKLIKHLRLDTKYQSSYVTTEYLDMVMKNKSMKNLSGNVVAITSSTNTSNWPKIFEWMVNTRVNTGILMIIDKLNSKKVHYLHQIVQNMTFNSMFYLMYINEKEDRSPIWSQVISFQGCKKGIINEITFDEFGRIQENFDLKGINIQAVALDWEPYFSISNNENMNNIGEQNSYLGEVMNILGNMMNFTWEVHRQEHGDWGTKPINGPFNASGVWGGVIGDVFYGNYQLSIRYLPIHFYKVLFLMLSISSLKYF